MSKKDNTDKPEEITKPKKKRRIFRKIIYVLITLFIVLELLLWFVATPLLRSNIQKMVSKRSKGVYSVEFDKISIELTTRTVKLINFKLKADTALYEKLKKEKKIKTALYQISLNSLEFHNMEVIRLLWNNELKFKRIELNQPKVEILGLPEKAEKDTVKYDAVHDDLYSFISPFLSSLIIDKVEINEGYFNLKTKSKKHSKAKKISLNLYKFKLDSTAYHQKKKLFYSDSLIFEINDYSLKLNDGVHAVKAENTKISLADSSIKIRNAEIYPITPKNNKLSYTIKAPLININGIDVYKAWFAKKIKLHSIEFDSAEIKIVRPKIRIKKKTTSNSKADFRDLYPLIKGTLGGVVVDNFIFKNAKFQLKKNIDEKIPSINIDNLSLFLEHFSLDSLSHHKKNKIFYSDNFTMSVSNYSMKIVKNSHLLHAESFLLAAKAKNILANNVTIKPIAKNSKMRAGMNINIPYLLLDGINLIEAYNTGSLYIKKIKSGKPKILINRYGKRQKRKNLKRADIIYDLVSDYLNSVKVESILLKNGSFIIKRVFDKTKVAFSKGLISLNLRNFVLDENTTKRTDRLFYAQSFEISLNKFSMKSGKDLHIFEAGKLYLSTFESKLSIENMRYYPKDNDNPLSILKEYNKSALTNLYIKKIEFDSIDIKKALFNKELNISSIKIQRPQLFIQKYKGLKKNEDTIEAKIFPFLKINKFANGDSVSIYDKPIVALKDTLKSTIKERIIKLFSGKVNSINITETDIDSGYIYLSVYDTLDNLKLSFDNKISAVINDIKYNKNSVDSGSSLFSGHTIIELSDYNVNLPGKLNKLKLKKIYYSSIDSSITVEDAKLIPNFNNIKKNKKPMAFLINLPFLKISGIDINQYLTDKTIKTERLQIEKPNIVIIKNQNVNKKRSNTFEKFQKLKQKLKKIKGFKVKNINIKKGKFQYVVMKDSIFNVISNADLNLNMKNIELDSLNPYNFVRFANGNLQIENFSFKLPDSMYSISADSLNYNLSNNNASIKNLKYKTDTAKNIIDYLNAKQKNSISLFNIDNAEIQNFDLKTLIFNRKIKAKKINIFNFNIDIEKYWNRYAKGKVIADNEDKIKVKLLKKIDALDVSKIDFVNASINYKDRTKLNKLPLFLKDISGSITNFNVNKDSDIDRSKIFFSDDIKIKLKKFDKIISDNMNRLTVRDIRISTGSKKLSVRSIKLTPLYDKFQFAKILGYAKSVINVDRGKIELKGLNLRQLAEEKAIIADSLIASGFDIRIFQDKQMPENNEKKPVPPWILLKNANNYINIKKIIFKNLNFIYEQNSKKSNKTGVFTIERITGHIKNFTNDSLLYKKKKYLRMRIFGYMQGEAYLRTSFRIPFRPDSSEYAFVGRIDSFNLNIFNSFIENTAFIKVQSGYSKKLSFFVNANDSFAEGNLNFFYKNLNLKFIDTIAANKGFLSFAANMLISNKNPKGIFRKLKQGIIFNLKRANQSVYGFWVKSVLSGVLSTFGIKSKDMRKRIRHNKKERKRLFRIRKRNKNATKLKIPVKKS